MSGGNDKIIETVLRNQHKSGSYISCPHFASYKYCWLRDGSFTAVAMDLAGHGSSADRYFGWTAEIIEKLEKEADQLIKAVNKGEPLLNNEFLPSRFTLDGQKVNDEWPDFQLDGYGIWLWAIAKHFDLYAQSRVIKKYMKSVNIVVKYLVNVWNLPNYNCWEENGEQINTSTLACIYGGLNAINRFIGSENLTRVAGEISEFVFSKCTFNGRLAAYAGSDKIDASLLWTVVPFGLIKPDDELAIKTIEEIEKKLLYGYGVHRYCKDTYYGGGAWPLLSCWLGWYYALTDRRDKAEAILGWVRGQANELGEIPEQSFEYVNDGSYYTKWFEMFGKPATPSIWAHALYLILLFELQGRSLFEQPQNRF
jgi:GH15 family glucan-1,4-alpha-glucosidase